MCILLSERECRDVAGGGRMYSGTGVLLSYKERSKVLGRLGEVGVALPRRSGSSAGGGESRCA